MRSSPLSEPLWSLFSGSVSAHSVARPMLPAWTRGPVLSGRFSPHFPGRIITPWLSVPGRIPRGAQVVSEDRLLSSSPPSSWVRICFDPDGPGGPLGDWFILSGCTDDDSWVSCRSSLRSPDRPKRSSSKFEMEGRRSLSRWWSLLSSSDSCAASSGVFGRDVLHDGSIEVLTRPVG